MTSKSGKVAKTVLSAVLGLTLFHPHPARSQNTDTSKVNASFYSSQPANTYAATYGRILTSCQNPALQFQQGQSNPQANLNLLLNQFFADPTKTDGSDGKSCDSKLPIITATSPCPNFKIEPVASDCKQFQVGGVFKKTLLDNKIKSMNGADCAISCRSRKLEALRGELKCLAKESDNLTQQISTQLTKAYTDNVQRFQKDVMTLNQGVKARESQRTFVNEKLGGRSASGEMGWVALQGEVSQGYNGMAAKIAEVKEIQTQIKLQRQALSEQTQQVHSGYVSKCFRETPQPSLRCIPKEQEGSVNVSFYDYIACIYEQKAKIKGKNNYVDTKTSVANATSAEAGSIKTLMNQIFATASSTSKVPTTADAVQKALETPLGSLDAAKVDQMYGAALSGFDKPGIPVRATFIKGLQFCNAWATPLVNEERNSAGKLLGASMNKIKELERQLGLKVDQPLDQYAQLYTKALRELTGNNYPLNVKQCRQYAQGDVINKCDASDVCRDKIFAYQVGCLNELRTNMEGIYRGTTQNSTIKMLIPSRNTAMVIPLECSGLDGCVRKMQTISRQIDDDVERLNESKQSYVQQANQALEKFTSEVSTSLARNSQVLNNRLKDLNLALSEYGEGISIKIEPYKAEDVEKDQDGLNKAPKNVLDLVGGRSNPPLPNISGNNFADSISGIGKATSKITDDQKTLREALVNLSGLAASCPKEGMQTIVDTLTADSTRLNSDLECGSVERYCKDENSARSNLQDALSAVRGLNYENLGIDLGALDNIDAGIDCTSIYTPPATTTGTGTTTGQVADNFTKCNAVSSKLTNSLNKLKRKLEATSADAIDAN
ncbi:MAG: hypothetical protein JNL01_04570 [Bdellovibrionales bacterium]|nr:hypothetical protein [Bdellovibrionales bacterium]